MKVTTLLGWAFVGILLIGGAATATESAQTLLTVGQFHGDEIHAESGQVWLGLFPRGQGFRLARTKVHIERVNDPIVDELPSERSGRRVSVTGQLPPIVLVPLSSRLVEGSVASAVTMAATLGREPTKFTFAKRTYQVAAVVSSTGPSPSCDITFSDGARSQIVETLEQCDKDKQPSLLWAGDLDRDGSPDLLLDVTDHYNVSALALYLSSKASANAMVGRIGYFRVVGC